MSCRDKSHIDPPVKFFVSFVYFVIFLLLILSFFRLIRRLSETSLLHLIEHVVGGAPA